mgnify:CR=1 FL=1
MKPNTVDILPKPFEWIMIPQGQVILTHDDDVHPSNYLQHDTVFDVPTFEMVKYPITNAQYRAFVDAGGYLNNRYWIDEGKKQRDAHQWKQPLYWDDSFWNGDDYPVVGISWYEAVAYCLWLSDVTNEYIQLPTEQQWQRAAQGNDEREYPWGNDFDPLKCNQSHEENRHQTTPIQTYENKGDSPYGVVDMVGNVWEWCLTDYETGSHTIQGAHLPIIRGGSWSTSGKFFLTTYHRKGVYPYNRDNDLGFRIVRIPK